MTSEDSGPRHQYKDDEGAVTQGITVQWLNLSGPKLKTALCIVCFLLLLLNKVYDLVGVLLCPHFLCTGSETGTVGVARSGGSSL